MIQELKLSVDRGVATLTLNRPHKRNALTSDMWRSLVECLDHVARLPEVGALGLLGEGTSFCAGGDLASVKLPSGQEDPAYRALAEHGLAALRGFPKPTVAIIDGHCVGAGCSLALACDQRFATPTASFAVPAVGYGILFERAGLDRLVELTGSGQAMRLLMSGTPVSGPEALAIGLVEVCADDAERRARDFLGQLGSSDRGIVAQTLAAIRRAARARNESPEPLHDPFNPEGVTQ